MKTNSNDWNIFWNKSSIKFSKISYSKKRIIKILDKYVNYGDRIADAGCGSGFFSNYFSQNTDKVFSIDYSDSALALCKQQCNGKTQTIKLDLLSDNFSNIFNNNLEIIFSDGLLEHFDLVEQIKILSNLYNGLAPKGKLITFVPNKFSPWQIIRPIFMPNIKEKPFILKNLIKLHKKTGFRIIESGGINVLPIEYSPEKYLGNYFGMLLYVVCVK